MTKFEAAVITAYTGTLIGSFDGFHEYITKLLGRPVYTHELHFTYNLWTEIKEKSRPDFLKICGSVTDENRSNQ
jgi:hypothetical protein